MRPSCAGASTNLIDLDDDSAREVTRANRSFHVSHPASDRPAKQDLQRDSAKLLLLL